MQKIIALVGNEHIYTVAMVTDSDCVSLFMAVNTIEYLDKNGGPDSENKWIPDEWGYSDGDNSALANLSTLLWEHSETLPDKAFFFDAVISAMKQLKEAGAFGEHSEAITFFVSISDDDETENMEDFSAKQLNTTQLTAAFLNRDK